MNQEYTITVFSEHQTGLLSRVVSIFTRRHVNVESLTTSQSSVAGIHRFTIVVNVSEEMVRKLVAQLEKQVDVVKAFYYGREEIVYQEIALYKVPTSAYTGDNRIEEIVRRHNARILDIEPQYIVIEKTGHEHETEALLAELQQTGIYEFVRSGRVAVVKPMERLNTYLRSLKLEEVGE
jgi:acetolactate synthase-1/3 small subunit